MNPPDDHDAAADLDLDPLARRLAAWAPAPARSGRDRLLFEAGVAAGRRQARWQLVAVVVPLLVGSTGWIAHERAERHRLELALADRTPAPALAGHKPRSAAGPSLGPAVTPGPTSYLALSHHLASAGWDGPDPVEPRPEPLAPAPRAGARPILTPFSGRRPQDFAEL